MPKLHPAKTDKRQWPITDKIVETSTENIRRHNESVTPEQQRQTALAGAFASKAGVQKYNDSVPYVEQVWRAKRMHIILRSRRQATLIPLCSCPKPLWRRKKRTR